MDVKLHKVHTFLCLSNKYVYKKKNKNKNKTYQTEKNHNFYYLVLDIREDTTLSLSYGFTPLDVDFTTSTRVDYNKFCLA